MTPDTVETRIGTLRFFDGIPTKQTAPLVFDSLDFHRGVETFLNGMPAASLEAIRRGMASLGARNKMIANDDGSIDLFSGPKARAGKAATWIGTVPGQGWFCLLRLYGPTEAWFDKTWRPWELELVE